MSEAPEESLETNLYRCAFCSQDFLTLDSCLTHVASHTSEQEKTLTAPSSLAASEDQQQTCSETVSVHTGQTTEDALGTPCPELSSVLNSLNCSALVSPAVCVSEVNNIAESDKVTVCSAEAPQNSVLVQTASEPQCDDVAQTSQQDTILVQARSSGAFIIKLTDSNTKNDVNGEGLTLTQTKSQSEKLRSENINITSLFRDSTSAEIRDACEKQAGSTCSSEELENPKCVGHKAGGVRRSGASSKSQVSKDGDRPYACSECPARYRFLSSLSVHKKRHSGSEPYQCKTCKKKFWHPTNLRVHERVHSKKRLFNCSVCGHGFNQSNDLRVHMRIHTGEMPLKCPVEDCARAFRDPACLRRHMNKHRGVQPHIACDQCPAKFFHPSGLTRHYKRHTGQKDHVCTLCKAAFARADTLKLHMRIHSGHKPYTCSACGQSFSDRSYCRRHVAKHDESEEARIISSFQDRYQAGKQKEDKKVEELEDEGDVMDFEAEASGDEPPRSPQAKKKPAVKVPVEIHVPDSIEADIPYASIEIEIPESDLVNEDGSEEMVYQYGDMLITISRAAIGLGLVDKPPAPVTEGASQEADSLTSAQLPSSAAPPSVSLQQVEHQYSRAMAVAQDSPADALSIEVAAAAAGLDPVNQVAGGLNPEVGKVGVTVPQPLSEYNEIVTSILEAELKKGRDHPFSIVPVPKPKPRPPRVARYGEKRWPCPDCNAAFLYQAELKRHQTKHTGELPYQCNICGKKVRDPSNLKRHVRTHTGERPYSCKVCGKTFRQAGHLTAHLRIHTGQRPYKCKVCPATFIEANHLRYHQKVHDGIKAYQCPKCDLSFIRNAELKRHSHVHTQKTEGNLKCHLCPAKFFRSDALRQHLSKKHDQIHSYQCDVCSKSFSRQSLLDRHCVKSKHSSSRSPGLTAQSPQCKPDAENSVVASALCELAAGGRSVSVNVGKTSGVPCLVSEDDAGCGVRLNCGAGMKSGLPVPMVVVKDEGQTGGALGPEVTVVEVAETGAGGHGDEHFVQKVLVDGGSVSGARVVLVESEDSGLLKQLQNVQSSETHHADRSHSVEPGPQSATHQVPVVDENRLLFHAKKPTILAANRKSSPKGVAGTVAITDDHGTADENSSEITVSADLASEPAVCHLHSDLVEKLSEESLISNISANGTVCVQSSESVRPSPQGNLVKEEPCDDTAAQHNQTQAPEETTRSQYGADSFVTPIMHCATPVMQPLVNSTVQQETVTSHETDRVKSPRGRGRGSSGAGTVAKVKPEPKEDAPSFVAPLRTRSGRERKIKTKLSL